MKVGHTPQPKPAPLTTTSTTTAPAAPRKPAAAEEQPLPPLPAGERPADRTSVPRTSTSALATRLPGVVTQKALLDFVKTLESAQWFTGKGRAIAGVDIAERVPVEVKGASGRFEDALLSVKYEDGGADLFHVPLQIARDDTVKDALDDPGFVRAMVAAMRDGARVGSVKAEAMPGAVLDAEGAVKALGVPQSNVSIKVGDGVIFKAYRKPEAGVSIEREVTSHLTRQQYKNTAQLLGTLTMETKQGPMTIGMAFEQIKSDGDGWKNTLAALASPGAGGAKLLEQVALLGTRIGEMHAALGAPVDDPAFQPRPITREDLRAWSTSIAKELDDTVAKASAKDPALGKKLAAARPALLAKLQALESAEPSGMKTRIHGDLHLGQVLSRNQDWVVLDFEGEPARTKEERRGFYAPLRDVAGMLRSFHYAEATARKSGADVPAGWAKEAGARFVDAYQKAVADTGLMPGSAFQAILDAVELEKALYEVRYELVSRPEMVDIPASRVLDIAAA